MMLSGFLFERCNRNIFSLRNVWHKESGKKSSFFGKSVF